MSKPTRDYLEDMLTYLADILSFTEGMTATEFKADRKTQLAVIRAFEVVGEVAKRIPQYLLETQPQINWRAVKGFRDVLIHQYDNVSLDIVWDAVKLVPAIHEAVQAMLTTLDDDPAKEDTP